MKLNMGETVAAAVSMAIITLCIILAFCGPNELAKGQGEGSDPLPQYAALESRVNINAATEEEIAAVEGISEKVAEDIVYYRNISPITDYSQLLEIDGVDEATVEFIKNKISFVN